MSEEFLFHDSYCVIARPGHPLTKLDEATPADLARYEWVVPSSGTPRRDRIEEIFAGIETLPRFNLETPSSTMSRAFLLRSDTITLMARSEVQYDLDLGILADVPCGFLHNVQRQGVTTRSDWLPTRAHDAFLACLRETASQARHDRVGRPSSGWVLGAITSAISPSRASHSFAMGW